MPPFLIFSLCFLYIFFFICVRWSWSLSAGSSLPSLFKHHSRTQFQCVCSSCHLPCPPQSGNVAPSSPIKLQSPNEDGVRHQITSNILSRTQVCLCQPQISLQIKAPKMRGVELPDNNQITSCRRFDVLFQLGPSFPTFSWCAWRRVEFSWFSLDHPFQSQFGRRLAIKTGGWNLVRPKSALAWSMFDNEDVVQTIQTLLINEITQAELYMKVWLIASSNQSPSSVSLLANMIGFLACQKVLYLLRLAGCCWLLLACMDVSMHMYDKCRTSAVPPLVVFLWLQQGFVISSSQIFNNSYSHIGGYLTHDRQTAQLFEWCLGAPLTVKPITEISPWYQS